MNLRAIVARHVRTPDGVIEAGAVAVLVLAAAIGLLLEGVLPSWTNMAAVISLVWAIFMSPHKPSWATGMVMCVSLTLGIGEIDRLEVVAVAMLLVAEVQLSNRYWIWGSLSLASGIAGVSLAPSGDVRFDHGSVVTLSAAVMAAVTAALFRQQVRLSEENVLAKAALRAHKEKALLAQSLHDGVANSLTRIVLLAQSPDAHQNLIEKEARQSVVTVHEVIRQLRLIEGENGGCTVSANRAPTALRTENAEGGCASLQGAVAGIADTMSAHGFQLEADTESIPRATIDARCLAVIEEMTTNIFKHGSNPVRLQVEVSGTRGRLLIVNNRVADGRDGLNVGGTGLGIVSMKESARHIGGSFTFCETGDTARALFEFPVYKSRGR